MLDPTIPPIRVSWRIKGAGLVLASLVACSGDATNAVQDTGAADATNDVDVAVDAAVDVAADANTDAADVIDDVPRRATEFLVVDVDPATSAPMRLAVQACTGLYNRELGGSVFTRFESIDDQWLDELGLQPARTVDVDAFLAECVAAFPTCARYDYGTQQALLPSVLTAAAATGAVPIDSTMAVECDDVVFDATTAFSADATPAVAARYVADRFLDATTGLAMLNPGYQTSGGDLENPALVNDMPPALVDYMFAERLFAVFLVNGCQPGTEEYDVLFDIVNDSTWPRPVGVYGYNNSWNVGGYLHEAQTRCLASRNMGAIPTETTNLSFFATRREPIAEPGVLEGNPPQAVTYDPETTYVAFVVGDGDNIRFIMATRNQWLRQRLAGCEQDPEQCAPISWSISPHLTYIAPDVLEWYYARSRETGADTFVLPPSGHLYAYPTSMGSAEQEAFAAATERDASLLGVSGVVHWDWFETWRDAEAEFLPRYAHDDGAIRGIFPINVPYLIAFFTWWGADEFYRVIEGDDGTKVAVFRSRQWRGVHGEATGPDAPFYLTPAQMADELAGYPRGTVTWVYMTSDGGLSLENSFMALVPLLAPHVQLVSADAAARLAVEADVLRNGGE